MAVTIINSGAVSAIMTWIGQNKLVVALCCVIAYLYISHYQQASLLKDLLLNSELESLKVSLEEMKAERETILTRIKQLETLKEQGRQENMAVKEKVASLTSKEKRETCLNYVKRLSKRRGL